MKTINSYYSNKASPYDEKPAKPPLDPLILEDIIPYLAKRLAIPQSAVRKIITSKLLDESKMMRQQRPPIKRSRKRALTKNSK